MQLNLLLPFKIIFAIIFNDIRIKTNDKEVTRCMALFLLSSAYVSMLEKDMTTHCSILAWRIPWTEEPEGLQSMGLQRVRHD